MNLKEKKDRGRAIYCKLWGEKEEPKENTLSYAQRMGYKNEREYQEAYKRSGIAERARAMYKEYQAYCKSLEKNSSTPHEAEELEADSIADKVVKETQAQQSGKPLSAIETFRRMHDNPDLDNVKIHTNDKAAESAEALNARAFTKGKDIYFNKEEFKPGTEDGDRLIAHEMAHVVQGGEAVRCKIKLDENEELLLTDIEPDIIKDILKNDLVSSYALRKLGNKPVLVRNGNILDIDLINNPVLKKYLYDLSKRITPGQKFTPSSNDLKTLEKEIETYLDMISSMKTRDISGDIDEDDDDLSKVNIPSEPIGKKIDKWYAEDRKIEKRMQKEKRRKLMDEPVFVDRLNELYTQDREAARRLENERMNNRTNVFNQDGTVNVRALEELTSNLHQLRYNQLASQFQEQLVSNPDQITNNDIRNFIEENRNFAGAAIARPLCNIISYWLLLRSYNADVPDTIVRWYVQQANLGRVGFTRDPYNVRIPNSPPEMLRPPSYFTGSYQVQNRFNMQRRDFGSNVEASEKIRYLAGSNIAIARRNSHFLIIYRDPQHPEIWRYMDHTNTARRGSIVEWNRIRSIRYIRN